MHELQFLVESAKMRVNMDTVFLFFLLASLTFKCHKHLESLHTTW